MLLAVPQQGACLLGATESPKEMGREIFDCFSLGNEDRLLERFNDLEKAIDSSEDPIKEGIVFLLSFIEQINTQYGMSLTIGDACAIARQNLDVLQLPQEARRILMRTIDLFESENDTVPRPSDPCANIMTNNGLTWPWEWKWFGLNKKKPPKEVPVHASKVHSHEDLPGNVYAGGAEILAAGLAFILGTVFPPAHGLGAGLLIDGVSRIINGCDELDKRRGNGTTPPGLHY